MTESKQYTKRLKANTPSDCSYSDCLSSFRAVVDVCSVCESWPSASARRRTRYTCRVSWGPCQSHLDSSVITYKTSIVLEFINFVEGQTDACHSWTSMNNVFSLILMDDKLISILSSIRLNLDMSKANKQTVHCLYNLDAPSEPNTVSHHPLTIKQSILHKQLLLLSESR